MILRGIERWRGLNLRDQPDGLEPGQCLDGINFQLAKKGDGIAARRGSQRVTLLQTVVGLHPFEGSDGTIRVIYAKADGSLGAINEAGVETHTLAAAHNQPFLSSARASATGLGALYLTGLNGMRRYDPSGFTTPTCTVKNLLAGSEVTAQAHPKGRVLGYWPGEERLIVAGFDNGANGPGGATTFTDQAWISEPNNPNAYAQTSFVRVGVGDGSPITGVCAYRDQVFVFKRDRFFVFTNTGTDARGVTSFFRRAVETGVGCVGAQALAVGDDGVYFVSRRGLHRTKGGDPEDLSALVGPLWSGEQPEFFTGGVIQRDYLDDVHLSVVDDELIMTYASTAAGTAIGRLNRKLVLDLDSGEAMLWGDNGGDVGEYAQCALRWLGRPTLLTCYRQYLCFYADGLAGDQGAIPLTADPTLAESFPVRYLGGFEAPRGGRVTRIVRHAVWGAGRVNVGLACDYDPTPMSVQVNFDAGQDVWGDGSGEDVWGDGTTGDRWGGGPRREGMWAERAYRGAYVAIWVGYEPDSDYASDLAPYDAVDQIWPSPPAGAITVTSRPARFSVSRIVQHVSADGPRNARTLTGAS